jgi:hypothetical protein
MLRVEVAGALPGVIDGGVKFDVAPVGRPVAESETELVNAPFCGVTVMV